MPSFLERLQNAVRGTYNGMSQAGQDLGAGIMDAATLPGDVYKGRVDLNSDEGFGRVMNLAGNVAGGGITTGTAPAGALGMFAGRQSKTFPWTEAIGADMAEQAGKSPTEIYKNTGLFRGVDDKLRYEIPDRNSRIIPQTVPDGGSVRAADFLDHPEFFKAYPQLADLPINHTPGERGAAFYRTPDGKPVRIDMDMNANQAAYNETAPRSLMLHELQHAVQTIEGFSPGASMNMAEITRASPIKSQQTAIDAMQKSGDYFPSDMQAARDNLYRSKWDAYARSAGETEARQVQERADWPLSRRMEMHPLQQQMTPQFPGDPAFRPALDQQWVPGKQLPFPVSEYDPASAWIQQFIKDKGLK